MFESEFREEQKAIQELKRQMSQLISTYERNLKTLQNDFNKIDGSSEKQIDDLFNELERNINSMIKDFKKEADQQNKNYSNMIDQEEKRALGTLKEYKEKYLNEFNTKAQTMFILKGEL